MNKSGPEDPTPLSKCQDELGGLNPKDLFNAGLEDLPPFSTDETRRDRGPPNPAQVKKPEREPPSPEQVAQLLPAGVYHIESLCGRGGMGAVYKGMQIRLKRPVAIKIMCRDEGRDFDFEARFEREAQAMAKLNHPNIVSVFDYGEAGPDYLYISMELVDGADLLDVIRTRQMTQEMALALLPQICDALQCAHDHGIVHRDVKPSNIMLTRDGRIKMTDFGLAKRHDVNSGFVTEAGTGMGTPDYAAPEQFDPNSEIDHRADIYALGVMIYQMITGQLPRGVWKPPSERAEVAPGWDEIVSHAMQADPADRYQQASEVKMDVSKLTPVSAVRTGGSPTTNLESEVVTRLTKQSRALVLLAIVACAAAIVSGAFYFFKSPVEPNGGSSVPGQTKAGRLAVSRTTDLLSIINPAKDTGVGNWRMRAGHLLSMKSPHAWVQIPVDPPEEYDFTMVFSVAQTEGHVVQILAREGNNFSWVMGAGQGKLFALEMVNGSDASSAENPTLKSLAAGMSPDVLHTSRVEVRATGVRAYFDGVLMVDLKTDFSNLSPSWTFRKFTKGRLGIGSSDCEITIEKLELTEVLPTPSETRS